MDVSFGEFMRGLADGVIVHCFATAHLSLLKMATLKKQKKSWGRNEMNCEVSLNSTSKLQLSTKNFAAVFRKLLTEQTPDLWTNPAGEGCNLYSLVIVDELCTFFLPRILILILFNQRCLSKVLLWYKS